MGDWKRSCLHLVQHGTDVSLKVLVASHRNMGSWNLELARDFQMAPSSSPPKAGVPGRALWPSWLLFFQSCSEVFQARPTSQAPYSIDAHRSLPCVEATYVNSRGSLPRGCDTFSSYCSKSNSGWEFGQSVESKKQKILKAEIQPL